MIEQLRKYKLMPGTKMITKPTIMLLSHHRMPGDIIAMTPLVRDIKKTHGALVKIYIDTPQGQDVWKHNPYVEQGQLDKYDLKYDLDYIEAAQNEERGLHISEGFRQDFMKQSGLHIIPSTMWPDIYLHEREIEAFKNKFADFINKPFWVICPGNKKSCQVKTWPKSRWKEFIENNKETIFIQIGQSRHGHKFLGGDIYDFIDSTTLRELFVLIYLSQGTIGYISLNMHIAAAFRKPSIVIGGGRENPSFYRYPNHITYFSTGMFSCCQFKGCFRGKEKTVREICKEYCFTEGGEDIPSCMDCTVKMLQKPFEWINKMKLDDPQLDCIIREPKKEKFDVKLSYRDIEVIKKEYNEKPPVPEGTIYIESENMSIVDHILEASSEDINNKYNEECEAVFEGERFHGEKYMEDLIRLENEREREKFDNRIAEEMQQVFEIRKPLFRMICNTCGYGGGERTALRIMNLMHEQGYETELVSATPMDSISHELIHALPEGAQVLDVNMKPTECDIVFFQANDTLYRYHKCGMEDLVKPWFNAGKRKVIGVNYTVWGLENYDYANAYICQSEKLRDELIHTIKLGFHKIKTEMDDLKEVPSCVLKPPADLSRFLNYDYGKRVYDNINLIRHSSQGDKKYADNIGEQINSIFKIDKSIEYNLMPYPTTLRLSSDNRLHLYIENAFDIDIYLSFGNVFWYWVPKDKFIEAGCNAVLEAMVAGLPILCNDNGGLVDIVDDDVGWMCRTEQEMYDAIKSMTMDEIKKKGARARKRVQEIVNPDRWVKAIIGE